MPLGKVGSPQDTLTEVVVSSLKWIKLGALGAGTGQKSKDTWEIVNTIGMRIGFLLTNVCKGCEGGLIIEPIIKLNHNYKITG